MYTPSTLSCLVDGFAGGSIRIYGYETVDDLSTLQGAGYFTDGEARGLKVGTVILTRNTDTEESSELRVTGVADGAATATIAVISMAEVDGLQAALDLLMDFSTRGDVEAYSASASKLYVRIAGYSDAGDGGGGLYRRAVTEPAHDMKIQSADGAWWEFAEPVVSVYQAGGVCDGEADDTAAWERAWSYANRVNFGALYVPAGATVTLTSGQSVWTKRDGSTPSPVTIFGDGEASIIQADFLGAGEVMLDATNPSNPLTRGDGPRVKDILLRCKPGLGSEGVGPVLYQHLNASNPLLDNVTFLHNASNSSLRMSNVFNGNLNNINIWLSGHSVSWKHPSNDTLLVSTTSGSTTVTSNENYFDSNDVGKVILIINDDRSISMIAKVAAYTSATEITIDRPATATVADARIFFETIRGTISAASDSLTINADRLTAADVGRSIVIVGADVAGRSLHATITEVSGTTITIDKSAATSVTDVEVYVSPALDIYSDIGVTLTNDLKINNLRMPPCRGLGVFIGYSVGVHLDGKIHAVNPVPGGSGAFPSYITHLNLLWEGSGSRVSEMQLDGSPVSEHRALVNGITNSGTQIEYLCGEIQSWQKSVHVARCHADAKVRIGLRHPVPFRSGDTMVETISTDGTVYIEDDDWRPSQRQTDFFDDFYGPTLSPAWAGRKGSDTQALAPFMSSARGGLVTLRFGDDGAVDMAANGSQLDSGLHWQPNAGGIIMDVRFRLTTAVTDIALFVGLTDQASSLEMPFTLGGSDALTSNATDAVGVLFDTAADTDNWWLVGVKNNVDASKQDAGVAPTAGGTAWENWRIAVLPSGHARFYRNGAQIGTLMIDAVTANVALTPVVAGFSRTAAIRDVSVDFIRLRSGRS